MNNYQKISMDDIIFEGRNKQYGAYELRKSIDKHSSIGLFVTLSAFVALLLIYTLNPFQSKTSLKQPFIVDVNTTNINVPIQKVIEQKPLTQTSPPKVNTTDFRELKPVADPIVAKQTPASQVEAFDKHLGTETVTNKVETTITIPNTTETSKESAIEIVAKPTITTTEIQTHVEIMPSYNGGKDALMEYLKNNIKPFQSDIENGLSGKVILRFYIDTDGTVRNPEVLKDNIGGRCAEAAINAIKKMPKWNAGKQNGIPVKVYFTLPVTFDFTRN